MLYRTALSNLIKHRILLNLIVISVLGAAPQVLFAQPEKISKSFAEIAKRVGPAVVSIDAKSRMSQPVVKGTPAPGDSDDIMEFFRRQMPSRPVYAVGSGFIVDKGGYIVTNAHVIENAARITIKLDNGEEYEARLVGSDDLTDLAVLKIEAGKELPSVKLGDSDKAEVGDWVLAIGSPFGLNKTVTAGIISQTRRETPYASAFQKFIQTDAAINRGNSGGPLVNMDGEVIGINSQIATSTGDYNGVGFALPSDEAANVYEQIVKNGKVRRGYLGAYLDSVKGEFARVYGMTQPGGAIVVEIRDKNGPAALAGLQAGDVLLAFNGQPLADAQDLIAKVAGSGPDRSVTLDYLRENGANVEHRSAMLKLAERPADERVAPDDPDRRKLPVDPPADDQKPFGLTLSPLTPTLAATYKLAGVKGLLVKEVNPASFIADVKNSFGFGALGEGDLIQRINRVEVTDLKTFSQIVSKLKVGDPVVLHVVSFNPARGEPQLKIVQFTVK
jgi:serine protease Do